MNMDLLTQGYSIVQAGSLEAFHEICSRNWRVMQTRDVRIVPDGMQYPERPDAVPFHTDHPAVPVVAWYCVRQDDEFGATMLIDSRRVVASLNNKTVDALSRLEVPLVRGGGAIPLLQINPFHIYWLPVFVEKALETACDAARAAVEEFRKLLHESHMRGGVTHVRLSAGEALFVDNQVILHGREAIPTRSTRHLVRNYLAY